MSLPKRPGDLPHDITLAELVQLYNTPDSTYPPSDTRPHLCSSICWCFRGEWVSMPSVDCGMSTKL